MLILKLLSQDSGKIVFNYYPEGKEDFGTLSLNEHTGEISVISVPECDEFGRYRIHAIKRIKEYFQNKHFELEDIVVWY